MPREVQRKGRKGKEKEGTTHDSMLNQASFSPSSRVEREIILCCHWRNKIVQGLAKNRTSKEHSIEMMNRNNIRPSQLLVESFFKSSIVFRWIMMPVHCVLLHNIDYKTSNETSLHVRYSNASIRPHPHLFIKSKWNTKRTYSLLTINNTVVLLVVHKDRKQERYCVTKHTQKSSEGIPTNAAAQ